MILLDSIVKLSLLIATYLGLGNGNQNISVESIDPAQSDTKNVLGISSENLTQTFNWEEEIPFSKEYVDDSNLSQNDVVSQKGEPGILRINETITINNNGFPEITQQKEIIKNPVNQIIKRGTQISTQELETPEGIIPYKEKLTDFLASSYHPFCDGCSGTGLTATGMKAGYGIIAVDPKIIPLRSKVYIPGYGTAIAGDTGGAIKGKRVDLGFDTLEGHWSQRKVDIYLLE